MNILFHYQMVKADGALIVYPWCRVLASGAVANRRFLLFLTVSWKQTWWDF